MMTRAQEPGARGPSVVIASFRNPALLTRCLDALAPQCQSAGGTLIVARAGETAETARLRSRYPGVRFVEAGREAGVPELRGLGIRAATGDPVLVTEDHCLPEPGWVASFAAAMAGGAAALGGGMTNASPARLVDWGAYFSEYGLFSAARPPVEGPTTFTAANVAYARRVADDVGAWAQAGAWENVIHDRLAARGEQVGFRPEIRVAHAHQYGFFAFAADRFRHGWSYARARLAEHPGAPRWRFAAFAAGLPLLLFARIARAAFGEQPVIFLLATPITLAYLMAWATGEAGGYVRGAGAPAE